MPIQKKRVKPSEMYPSQEMLSDSVKARKEYDRHVANAYMHDEHARKATSKDSAKVERARRDASIDSVSNLMTEYRKKNPPGAKKK